MPGARVVRSVSSVSPPYITVGITTSSTPAINRDSRDIVSSLSVVVSLLLGHRVYLEAVRTTSRRAVRIWGACQRPAVGFPRTAVEILWVSGRPRPKSTRRYWQFTGLH